MKKILLVGNDPSVKGGITTVISQILEYDWKKKNIELKFITTYIDKSNIQKILFFVIAYLKILINFIFWRPDKIHIHMSYQGSFTRASTIQKLAKLFKIEVIVHLHGSEFKKWYDKLNDKKKSKVKSFIKNSNYFVVLGEKWNKIVREIEPTANLIVINNAVRIPNQIAHYNSFFNILFLGVLIKRKGIDDLIDSASLLINKYNVKNIKFLIAGTGNEEEQLKKKVINLKLEKYIEFIGWVDNEKKEELFKESQLFVLPSYNEGLPMSILEAMSYGIPVVATNVGDISTAVIDNKTGELIYSGDVEKLAEKIYNMVKLDKQNWSLFSNNCLELIKKNFSSEEFYKKIEMIYKGEENS